MDDEKSTAHPDFAINKSFEISGGSQYPESRAELGGENSVEYGNEVPMNGESNVAKEIEQVGPELTEKSDDPKAKGQIKDDKKDRKEAKKEAKKEEERRKKAQKEQEKEEKKRKKEEKANKKNENSNKDNQKSKGDKKVEITSPVTAAKSSKTKHPAYQRPFSQIVEPERGVHKIKSLKEKFLEHSKWIKSEGRVDIFELPHYEPILEDESNSIRALQIAVPGFPVESVVDERVLLCVGATGVGKTTLINGLANYLLDVHWEDNFRFKIIPHADDVNEKQASSQTQWVTAYSLYVEKGEAMRCIKYTIIDTPGFGDTRGIKKDKELDEKIRNLLDQKSFGLDHLHAVCFTTQAGETKMNAFQTYVYNRVLALFGKDVEQNIFMMVTFADASRPLVIQTLQENKIPYRKFFKFNNSALFIENQAEDAMELQFNKMYWQMGIQSFQSFMEFLDEVEPVSLTLTKEVMAKRQALQVYIQGLQENIKQGLVTLDQLRQEKSVISQYQAEIDKNSEFTYTVKEYYAEKVDKLFGTCVTNCLKCNRTCHMSCKYAIDDEKKKCIAMDASGYCRVCAPSDGGKCHYTEHFNMAYYFKYKERTVQKQSKDLYQKYEKACEKKMNCENMLKSLEDSFSSIQGKVLWQTNEIRKCLAALGDIALKPNPLTTLDYIDQMIVAEQDCCQEGWKERVEQLKIARKEAKYLKKLEKEKGINPWGDEEFDIDAQTTESRKKSLSHFLSVFKPKLKERMMQKLQNVDEEDENDVTEDATSDEEDGTEDENEDEKGDEYENVVNNE